ncbi:MAG: hypothetical protein J5815_03820 [Clostridia bacterium]|nr:hypothetical protein [Clostridia bacterium]
MALSKKNQVEQKPKRAKVVPSEDALNYVCIASDDEPAAKPKKEVKPAPAPAPAPAPVKEEPKKAPAKETVEEQDERAQEEELENEEEPVEELETVEDVKVEEPVTLKQSMAVARHNVGHKSKIGKKFCADYLEEKYKQNAETNRRENFTSTGLPLADTHYAVNDKKKKCFVYVYDLEETSMLLINSDEKLADELNHKHGNVHKSAFPKSKDQWFSVALDDSYTEEEVQDILDRCYKGAGGRDADELSLKESLALAKTVKSAHTMTKKAICEYLEGKYGDEVEINTRENYTSTGLPLADTHYVKDAKGKSVCFVYVYETDGSMMLLIKANQDFAKALKESHENVHKSAFPKAKEAWHMVLLDDSFSNEEVHKLLDDVLSLNK